ncbi:MFS transporter [Geobacter sp. SVR]|uniref:MFS transporter n=1 Tax=Geobacter sp. SVR TaxID=2495594 RepID=UPI00143F03FE|nr:MFS transporter [Geobacter sp. SVR]BCS55740.1 MFS transporter [Geobacter sp. SVR]GCF83744.1 MFS transporter [Geobacter sp. SVR]
MKPVPCKGRIHYGWIIAATGTLVLFSCLGLARYAYTMLLPGMQAGLGLAYRQMGFIGTANFTGYLLAVLLAPPLIHRFRPRVMISAGLLLIAVCMLVISRSHGFRAIAFLYMLVGFGGGFANIPMMALVTYWFHSEQRGKAAGLVIGGNGAAIVCAGYLIPLLNRSQGVEGWRSGWLLLGLITMAAAVCAGLTLRNHPSEMGLEPVGRQPPHEPTVPCGEGNTRGILPRLGLLYLAFGATFMVYGTFIVATMVKEYGFSEARAGLYWSWVGVFSVFSGVGFGSLSDRIGRKRGLALVFAVQTAAYLLAGLRLGGAGLAVSISLYGLAVFAIPAIMAAAVGDYLGPSRAAAAFATVTVFFALGQTIGPAGAGLMAGTAGSFSGAYLLSALVTACAGLYAGTLPRPVTTGE